MHQICLPWAKKKRKDLKQRIFQRITFIVLNTKTSVVKQNDFKLNRVLSVAINAEETLRGSMKQGENDALRRLVQIVSGIAFPRQFG